MELIDKIKKLFEPKMIDYPKTYLWMFKTDGSLDTDALKHCPQFYALKNTKQSSVWHKEGSAWNHTLLVYKEMCDILSRNEFNKHFTDNDRLVLKLAALCHDLGKATTTYWSDEEKTWKCKNHGLVGEKITRELLYNIDVNLREEICWLVRYHMDFHHFLEKPLVKRAAVIKKLSNGQSTIEKLLILNIADCLGSHSEESVDINDRIYRIKDSAVNFGIYQFNKNMKRPERQTDDFTAYIMIGVPGSGKDTYIKEHLSDCQVICRDDIRNELANKNMFGMNLSGTGEKEVTKIVNQRIEQCCKNNCDFIINQTLMKRSFRDKLIKQIREYGANPKIVYILVETPDIQTCIKRRCKTSPKWDKIIRQMFNNFEFPEWTESYDELIISKQHS